MKNAFEIRRELTEQETLASLFGMVEKEIKDRESSAPLLKTPESVFSQMEGNNEIRGRFAKLEFLRLNEDDLVFAITDIHGDREKQQAVLDYIKQRKTDVKGDIHLVVMGDVAGGVSVPGEDIEPLFDLLRGRKNGDFELHMLQGNVERDAPPIAGLYAKIQETEGDIRALPAMTDLFKSLPDSLFLRDVQGRNIMLTHSVLPLVNKKKFEEEGLEIFNRDAEEIDKLGLRKYSGVWATFDGVRKKSEYGGKKSFQLGKDTFQSILGTLGIERILRGHDSGLIKKEAKDTGVHRVVLDEGEVDTFHTSSKATNDFGIFVEISGKGDLTFRKI